MTATNSNASQDLSRWVADLGELLGQIEAWSQEAGWAVAHQRVHKAEPDLGSYETRELHIKPPGGLLVVDPVARRVMGGAQGRVDIYSLATLNRMVLLRRGGEWVLRTDAGVNWPQPWGRETFLAVARELAVAA